MIKPLFYIEISTFIGWILGYFAIAAFIMLKLSLDDNTFKKLPKCIQILLRLVLSIFWPITLFGCLILLIWYITKSNKGDKTNAKNKS